MSKDFNPTKRPANRPTKPGASSGQSAEEFARRLKAEQEARQIGFDYRSASLKIHGPVCARCGREFYGKNLKALTVHHKDGNPLNNPRDGSNWENLCIYCHEAEHSKGLLADYVSSAEKDAEPPKENAPVPASGPEEPKVTLADKLKAAMEKKK